MAVAEYNRLIHQNQVLIRPTPTDIHSGRTFSHRCHPRHGLKYVEDIRFAKKGGHKFDVFNLHFSHSGNWTSNVSVLFLCFNSEYLQLKIHIHHFYIQLSIPIQLDLIMNGLFSKLTENNSVPARI